MTQAADGGVTLPPNRARRPGRRARPQPSNLSNGVNAVPVAVDGDEEPEGSSERSLSSPETVGAIIEITSPVTWHETSSGTCISSTDRRPSEGDVAPAGPKREHTASPQTQEIACPLSSSSAPAQAWACPSAK